LPKFILVDHSLRDTGGHHYPYATSVLQAAAAAGWTPVLATHRSFAARAALPADWPVHALFHDVSYSALTLDTQSARGVRPTLWRRLFAPWSRMLRAQRRARHARRFAQGCARLFAELRCADGDVVFVPTASELDLQGLAQFLGAGPPLPALRWHAQLHFGIHARRDWRRHGDARAATAMTESLRASLRVLAPLGLRLWCTTEPLAAQYQALGVADFRALPYPVHPSFTRQREFRAAPRPARIACLGHARREKNQRLLPALLEALWLEHFATGAAQLVVQNARPAQRAALEATVRRLRAATGARGMEHATASPLDLSAGRLDQQQYAALVCGSDVGLLLYDARRYHDRCSGVLLEMRVAGVPVIVPARSWLADQIEVDNQVWLEDCATELAVQSRLLALPVPAAGGALPVPSGCGALLLTRQWSADRLPADGETVTVEQRDERGGVLASESLWFEARAEAPQTRSLLPLHDHCRILHVAVARDLQLQAVSGTAPPRGALGLAIDSPAQAAGALHDLLRHLGHYKRHAAEHAVRCAVRSSAARIVAEILERD